MNLRVFEPAVMAENNAALVLLNQVGSTITEDAGRDARSLAETFEMPVIGADRPGTAGYFPSRTLANSLSTPAGYVAETTKLGKRIDAQLESLGIQHALIIGRSAGGLGALALTRSETITAQRSLFAADPVACEAMSIKAGEQRFKDYHAEQKQLQADDVWDELIKPLPPGLPKLESARRIGSMILAFLYDKFNNKAIWASAASLEYAAYTAQCQPEIAATLEFAEHSLTATPAVYETAIFPIQLLRTTGQPFIIRKSEHTTHASYDNREFMADALRPAVLALLSKQ